MWTDHKNLQYICSAKRLNSLKPVGPCSLPDFFYSLLFILLSYCPGSHNVKPGALSCQFQRTEDAVERTETILPASCTIAALTWDIEERVRAATEGQPGPSSCPLNSLFVPPTLQSDLLPWAHSSKLSCHPGVQRTQHTVLRRFWWPTLTEEHPGICQGLPNLINTRPQGCFNLSLYLIAHGPTYPWTLLLVFPILVVTYLS